MDLFPVTTRKIIKKFGIFIGLATLYICFYAPVVGAQEQEGQESGIEFAIDFIPTLTHTSTLSYTQPFGEIGYFEEIAVDLAAFLFTREDFDHPSLLGREEEFLDSDSRQLEFLVNFELDLEKWVVSGRANNEGRGPQFSLINTVNYLFEIYRYLDLHGSIPEVIEDGPFRRAPILNVFINSRDNTFQQRPTEEELEFRFKEFDFNDPQNYYGNLVNFLEDHFNLLRFYPHTTFAKNNGESASVEENSRGLESTEKIIDFYLQHIDHLKMLLGGADAEKDPCKNVGQLLGRPIRVLSSDGEQSSQKIHSFLIHGERILSPGVYCIEEDTELIIESEFSMSPFSLIKGVFSPSLNRMPNLHLVGDILGPLQIDLSASNSQHYFFKPAMALPGKDGASKVMESYTCNCHEYCHRRIKFGFGSKCIDHRTACDTCHRVKTPARPPTSGAAGKKGLSGGHLKLSLSKHFESRGPILFVSVGGSGQQGGNSGAPPTGLSAALAGKGGDGGQGGSIILPKILLQDYLDLSSFLYLMAPGGKAGARGSFGSSPVHEGVVGLRGMIKNF